MPSEPLDRLLPRPADRKRIEAMLARGWSLPFPDEGLGRLQGRSLGPLRLLVLAGAKNNVGASYFQFYLTDSAGRLSQRAFAQGLHNSGRYPAYNWIELVRYDARPAFEGDSVDLAATGLDRQLFRWLGDLLPPGGHIMVEYESPSQRDSERILTLGYPAAASPLGALLLAAGCLSLRDWYIPEGGREGPRKLQGFKPLTEEQAGQRARALADALGEFLARPPRAEHGPWAQLAHRLGREALAVLTVRLDRPQAPT